VKIGMLAGTVLMLGRQLRRLAVVRLGIGAGAVGLAVLLAVSDDTYIEQTFGVRRLATYVALELTLLIVGLAEGEPCSQRPLTSAQPPAALSTPVSQAITSYIPVNPPCGRSGLGFRQFADVLLRLRAGHRTALVGACNKNGRY
jgi:hypothetical protein